MRCTDGRHRHEQTDKVCSTQSSVMYVCTDVASVLQNLDGIKSLLSAAGINI